MPGDFQTGLEVLKEHETKPRLSTGIIDLDDLLAGGIEIGTFTLLYSDSEAAVDRLLYGLLCRSQLPEEKYGFDGRAIFLNCANYREEQQLLDPKLLINLFISGRTDAEKSLDKVTVISAFNTDQAKQAVNETCNIVADDERVKLVVVRNIAKLFIEDGIRSKQNLEQSQQLQHLIATIWQTCSTHNVALVVSCRPRRLNSLRPLPPEGGVFLRHLAQVMLCLKKKGESGTTVAYLLKHPKRQPRMVEFTLSPSDSVMGRLTMPFRSQLQEEIENLAAKTLSGIGE